MRISLSFIFLLISFLSTAQTAESTGSGYPVNSSAKTGAQSFPVTPVWDEVEPFVNGFARVLKKDQFFFINQSGATINENGFEAARNFSNNLAAVKRDGKWGFINHTGQTVIPYAFEIVYDFKENITGVSKNNKWYLINTRGAYIKELNISSFYGFHNGLAKIETDSKSGTVNLSGEIITNDQLNKPVSSGRIPYYPSSTNRGADCPENVDFENGTFLNWKCFIGRVDSIGSTNVITVNPSAPINNRHTLYSRAIPSVIDPFGLFPINPPDGSQFAVRLGNTNIGAQAERIQYAIHVPLNDSNFSLKYDYAVVFEDPGHTNWTQPRFTARLRDSATNAYVNCASFEYISTSNLPGFARSTVDTGVMYKPWSSVFMSLRGYAGKTMFLEFTTADCVRRGHWGYAYVDVEKPCGQSIQVQYECASPNITNLSAPPGFQIYQWWDSTFTNLLATGQNAILNPGPPANSTIWLEMIPFSNFGCKDTIPVKITGIFNADFKLSDTIGVCAPHHFIFYNQNVPSTSAIWNFGDGTTGTGDTVSHTYLLPGNYTVTLDVILPSGCIGTVQKIVSVIEPVGSFYFNGSYFCNSQQVQFSAVVTAADSLFWNFGDGVILPTTQTSVNHSYALPGVYLPFLTVQSAFGCHNTLPGPDTIKIEKLKAGFSASVRNLCGSATLSLTDTSYSYFGINAYHWNFGDGTTGSGSAVSHTYTTTGFYNIQLTITGMSGCTDVITKPIFVQVNQPPVANITGAAIQCGLASSTFTGLIQSIDPINSIHWSASNGNTGSGTNFLMNFTLPGIYNIQMIAGTVNGCFDTASHAITVNAIPDILQPNDQELCSGSATAPVHFSGSVNGSTYSWTNNNPFIGLPANGTGDIASFTPINFSSYASSAILAVTPTVNNCAGNPVMFVITVNPVPDVDQPANMVLCRNTSSQPISFTGSVYGTTFSWTNSNPSIGLSASGTGDIPVFTAINNSSVQIIDTITVTPLSNGCPGDPRIFTITIDPSPEVTSPPDQAICAGSATNPVTFTGAGTSATYSWTNNNTSIGLAANGSGDIGSFIASNNTMLPVTAIITVTPTLNNCTGNSKTFTITVNPIPEVNQPADQALCNNAQFAAISFSGSVNGATYSWTNDNPSIGLAANGNGDLPSFTATNLSSIPTSATITVWAVANGCAGPSKTFAITVNPTPTVTPLNNLIFCNGNSTTTIGFNASVTGATFNWTNDNPGIGLAPAGTGNIPPFIVTNHSNSATSANINITSTSNGCTGPSTTFTITVNPSASVNQPGDQSVCSGASTSAVTFGGPVNGASFSWTNNDPSIGLPASGMGNILPFTATNQSDTSVTATVTVSAIANGCPGTSKSFLITVKPLPQISQPASQVICNGASSQPVLFSSTVSGTIYNWMNNHSDIGLPSAGTGNIPVFVAVNTTDSSAIATVLVTPESSGCAGTPQSFNFTVNPSANVHQPIDQLLCGGSSTNAVLFSGSISGTTYSWTNNNPGIGLPASGNGNIPSFIAVNNTNVLSSATITVSPAALGCPGPAKSFVIGAKPLPNVIRPTNQALCNGFATTPVIFSATQSGAAYNWTNNTPSIGLAASGTGNIPSFTTVNNTDTAITATIIVKATADGCTGSGTNAAITVNPTPDVSANNNINVCEGRSVQLLATGAAQYSWSPATGLSCASCPNPITTPADSIRYVVQGTSVNGCVGYDTVALRVIKPFRMRVNPGDTLCEGETTGLKAMNANTYVWSPSNSLDRNDIAAPRATPQTTTLYRVIGYDAFNCFTDTGFVLVKVGPRPAVDIGGDMNASTGTIMTFHPVIQNGPIVSYLWTPSAGLSCSDCATPTTTATHEIEYTLTVTNIYGCVARDQLRVSVFCLNSQVFIPNAFTPDNDGLNDILMIRGTGIRVKSFRIFNRWGELVFEKSNFNPNDPAFGWNGKVRGVTASPDVFVYTADIICDNGTIYTYKGNTTIIK